MRENLYLIMGDRDATRRSSHFPILWSSYFRGVSPIPPHSYFFLYRFREQDTCPLNVMVMEKPHQPMVNRIYSHQIINIPYNMLISDIL